MQSTSGTVEASRGLFIAQDWVPHIRCPACLTASVDTTRTMPADTTDKARVRYHKCRTCRALFKSVEAVR
jgi:hypothetical protein